MVHVCFSLYDKLGSFSKFIGTVMLSLFENTSLEVTIHILHDNTLTDDNRDKLIHIAEQYHQLVKFYNVEELCADKLSVIIGTLPPNTYAAHFTVGMFYRFFIAHILPEKIKKAIYLDADIIVNLDINELWQVELGNKAFGAIPNLFQIATEKVSNERTMKRIPICREGIIKPEDYFNSGVLLLNLRFMRNANKILMNGIKFIAENPRFVYFDQDILNYCFSTMFLKLPVKFNRYVMLARLENELATEKKIYHYAGGKNGLGLDTSDPFNRLWWSYFIKTPWFDVNTIDKLFKGATDSMLQMSNVSPDKTHVFVVDEEHAFQIERNFSVHDTEEVIIVDTESEENLQQLTELMNASRGKKIFFVGIPNIDTKLLEMGFAKDKDFFNVCGFYSPIWADLTSNYNLILSI